MNDMSTEPVVATYRNHSQAEDAVRRLADAGIPVTQISIIGRDFELREDIQGFYRPSDAAARGAGEGAWFGGLFGLMLGVFGFFVFPVVGGLFVFGPLAGLVAGAIGGAGVGPLVNALVASGVPRHEALKIQDRLQAGEFLVLVRGTDEQVAGARQVLGVQSAPSMAAV